MSDLTVPSVVLVTVGTTEAARIAKGNGPTMKPIIAGFILGICLYGIYAIDDYLGHTFAILIVVTAILANGMTVISGLEGKATK